MRWTAHALLVGALLPVIWTACREETPPTGTGGSGAGAGGCEPAPPAALFTLVISADPGPVPADTTLRVRWSAGEEPLFVLDDATTHMTLEEGSNVVCDVPSVPEPDTLTCELWTGGATEVEITATGYDDWVETLVPEEVEGCDEPIPSQREIVLVETMEMGTNP